MIDHYTYHITWSVEDAEYVGLCHEFPSLSCLEPSADAAFAGIRQVVADILEDMQTTGETPPTPLAELVDSRCSLPSGVCGGGLHRPGCSRKDVPDIPGDSIGVNSTQIREQNQSLVRHRERNE